MTAAAFCKEQKINPQRFYSWRKRFNSIPQNTGFIRLVPTPSTTPRSGVRILLEHEICVEVDKGFDPITLREAIDALCSRG
jgi:transposase